MGTEDQETIGLDQSSLSKSTLRIGAEGQETTVGLIRAFSPKHQPSDMNISLTNNRVPRPWLTEHVPCLEILNHAKMVSGAEFSTGLAHRGQSALVLTPFV